MAILANVARSVDAARLRHEVLLYETAIALDAAGTFGTVVSGVVQADRTAAAEGDWIERGHLTELVLHVKADQAGALPSLIVEESGDGSAVDETAFSLVVLANKASFYVISLVAKYFRVRYTNGAVNQGSFELRVTGRLKVAATSIHELEHAHASGEDEDFRMLYQYLKNGSSIEMDVNGSSTVVTFEYTVPDGEHAYVERIMFVVIDTKRVIGGFFSLSALTNGLLIEQIDPDGTTVVEDFGSADAAYKTHADIGVLAGLVDIESDTSGNLGEFGIRWTLSKAGGVIHLGPGQIFRVTVRDNLEAFEQFRIMLQGVVARSTKTPPLTGAQP